MAKPNYKRQKDQKDQARKRKQDEKLQRKAERLKEGGEGEAAPPDQDGGEDQASGESNEPVPGV